MSLSDELLIEDRSEKSCKVCKWVSELPPDDQDAFTIWVEKGKPVKALHRACQRQGLTAGKDAMYQHCAECVRR